MIEEHKKKFDQAAGEAHPGAPPVRSRREGPAARRAPSQLFANDLSVIERERRASRSSRGENQRASAASSPPWTFPVDRLAPRRGPSRCARAGRDRAPSRRRGALRRALSIPSLLAPRARSRPPSSPSTRRKPPGRPHLPLNGGRPRWTRSRRPRRPGSRHRRSDCGTFLASCRRFFGEPAIPSALPRSRRRERRIPRRTPGSRRPGRW